MKIGVDIRTLMDARYSGVSEYTFNLLKELFKLDPVNEYKLFYNSFGACPNLPAFKEGNIELVRFNYPNKILNYFLFKIFNYPKIDRRLGVDVFFQPHLNFIGLSGATKSLIAVHDLSFLKNPEFFSARKNFWHKLLNVKKLLKKFNLVVAVSESTKRDLIRLCGVDENKIKVIYSGVGEGYGKMTAETSAADKQKLAEVKEKYGLPDKFILYLGTVEPRKNVDGLIRAYNKTRAENRELAEVKLVIAGAKGWKSSRIYAQWRSSEFKDDIKFLGYVDAQDKAGLYNLAEVFVYPSFYEGFGLPPLEAMASGTPVIAGFATSLPEVTGGAALTIDPYDINGLARALKTVLLNDNLKQELSRRSLKQAEKFNWRTAAGEYLAAIKYLANA